MSPSHPGAATEPSGGWWPDGWWPFVLAILLVASTVAVVAMPVAAPAAVARRRAPPPAAAPRTAVPLTARPPTPVPPTVAPPDLAVSPSRVPALWMPVAGAVVRGFDARAGPYGAGHRGIDIAAPVGELVRAPAAGRVVFAGPVAGVDWVSLLVAPGVLVTMGPLLGPGGAAGQVRSGTRMGRVGPGHVAPAGQGGSGGATTLHLSVRVDGVYVDPLAYLIDRPRPRLAPLPAPPDPPGA
jgi:murein DD-endopeptidase MepM/ murein hydrolase activator NlpD